MTIRIIVADDQALVRSGFAMILGNENDIDIVAEAGTGNQAIALTKIHKPDIVLMDIRMPEMDGLLATEKIVQDPELAARVLVLTTFDPDEYIYRALQAGASGFLLKDTPPVELISAVRTIAGGGALLAPSITKRLIGSFAKRGFIDERIAKRLERLTNRERAVLTAVAQGLSNQEVASELFVEVATVKTHISSILSKLGLRDRTQAVIFAYESGLVETGTTSHGY
ncbi:response regulator [Maritalea porphyrae]|uniref:response regulator n=1 Tax=Maritalea porphyrae TaxID=880732 RepID=UPI0022B01604|nr:response regulator transcription factor [Maritalea porphyrae]MCZ4273425.1 response regulator transcription factor [Maritalea porphyrae]